jgi:hypothetical protein
VIDYVKVNVAIDLEVDREATGLAGVEVKVHGTRVDHLHVNHAYHPSLPLFVNSQQVKKKIIIISGKQ